nr:MAG TPA: hypothetical protein [Caudoviricetes sp.]DAJ94907.1 MAG TPA: hypothetical protein [Caudoviricetes sp.]
MKIINLIMHIGLYSYIALHNRYSCIYGIRTPISSCFYRRITFRYSRMRT